MMTNSRRHACLHVVLADVVCGVQVAQELRLEGERAGADGALELLLP